MVCAGDKTEGIDCAWTATAPRRKILIKYV